MKTTKPMTLGRKGLLIGCCVSCVLFQLMFCGLMYIHAVFADWMPPDWVFGEASREVLIYFHEQIEAASGAIAWLTLAAMLCLVLHLIAICFFALRRPQDSDAAENAGSGE